MLFLYQDYLLFLLFSVLVLRAELVVIMSPQPKGGGHIVFGADPVGVGISVCFFSARYLLNRWADFD